MTRRLKTVHRVRRIPKQKTKAAVVPEERPHKQRRLNSDHSDLPTDSSQPHLTSTRPPPEPLSPQAQESQDLTPTRLPPEPLSPTAQELSNPSIMTDAKEQSSTGHDDPDVSPNSKAFIPLGPSRLVSGPPHLHNPRDPHHQLHPSALTNTNHQKTTLT